MSGKIDYNKNINCRCYCGKALNWIQDDLLMLEPCEHIIHKSCKNNKNRCDICNTEINKYYTEKELSNKKENISYYQKYIDMLSVRHCNYMSKINKNKLIKKIPKIVSLSSKIGFLEGEAGAIKLTNDIMNLANVELHVMGRENIPKGKKVIIANHTCDFDFIPIYYLFKCTFLSSTILLQSTIGKMVYNLVKPVLIQRGEKGQKTVEKMRKSVDENGSICVFPEGILTHPDTLIRFRSGAFNIGYQICPIVLTYEPNIFDCNISKYIQKMLSQDKLTIKITILPPENPPFTQNKIEEIREKMAKVGNMALARTVNRDVRDISNE